MDSQPLRLEEVQRASFAEPWMRAYDPSELGVECAWPSGEREVPPPPS